MNRRKVLAAVHESVTALLLLFLVASDALAQVSNAKGGKPVKIRLHIDGFSKSKSGAI
jgi:hypothetical protein